MSVRPWAGAAAGCALALAASGCGDKNNGTGLLVRVSTDLAAAQYDRFDIGINSGQTVHQVIDRPAGASPEVAVAVAPAGNPDRAVEITAAATLNGTPVVSQTFKTSFSPGRQEEVRLFLSRDCLSPVSCEPGKTCTAGARCVTSESVAMKYPLGGLPDAGVPGDGPPADRPPDTIPPPADGPGREVGPVTGTWMLSATVAAGALQGVFPISEQDVWAVGRTGLAAGVVFHYDGQAWAPEMLPSPAGVPGPLNAVWAAGADDIWVVGDRGWLLRKTKGVWQRVPVGNTADLTGVWGSGAGDVWFAGKARTVLRWDGAGVTSASTGIGVDLLAIAGSSATDIWTAGLMGEVYKWNGQSWGKQDQTVTTNPLFSIWSNGPTDVWAVGSGGVALHQDGTGWKLSTTGLASATGVWGAADNQVWAVGRKMGVASEGGIAHFDGLTWMPVTAPAMTPLLQAVRGRGAGDIWAVGGDGAILRYR
jgi:hypothetical protein